MAKTNQPPTEAEARQRAARVRLLCLDVDGTLTDGRLYFVGRGISRAFHALDGLGVQRFVNAGGVAAIVTAATKETEDGIEHRAKMMGVRHIYQEVGDKLAVVKTLLQAENFTAAEAAFVGDDLPDLPPMQYVGFACAPKNAVEEVLQVAHYIPPRPAGGGAVRDVCEFILAARG